MQQLSFLILYFVPSNRKIFLWVTHKTEFQGVWLTQLREGKQMVLPFNEEHLNKATKNAVRILGPCSFSYIDKNCPAVKFQKTEALLDPVGVWILQFKLLLERSVWSSSSIVLFESNIFFTFAICFTYIYIVYLYYISYMFHISIIMFSYF